MAKLTKDELYWQKRNEELEAEWFRRSQKEIERELASYYAQALKHIEKDINDLYARFAIDNSMSMTAAYSLLQGDEFRVWRMDMQEYLKQIEATGDKKLLRELNTLAMRSRISRLDKLKAETYVELSKLAGKFGRSMDKFLPTAYKDFYYRNLFEIGRKRGLASTPAKVESNKLENVLRAPWSGKNYSARIWANQEKLAEILQREITAAMHRGASVENVSKIITQKMGVGMSDARRLVRTELNYVQNRAALDSIKDAGMKYYRFVATLDRRTSAACRAHDGKFYPVDEGTPGTNMPPLHPHCRSTIVGSIKGDSTPKGSRAARDKAGQYIRVPADMKYDDWKAVYVDKNISYEQWKQKDGIIKTKSGIDKIEKLEKSGMSHSDYTEFLQILNGHSNSDIVKLYRDYADGIQSVTLQGTGGAYSSGNNTIVYSYPKNKYQGMNKYRTLAHEYGHYFDAKTKFPGLHFVEIEAVREATTLKKVFPTVASSSDEFLASMRKDKEYIKNILTQDVRNELRQNHSSCGVQDAIDGLFTNSRISWGHGEKYYNRKYASVEFIDKHTKMGCKKKLKQVYLQLGLDASNQAKTKSICRQYEAASEAWANIMSAIVCGGKELEYVEKYLPNSYQMMLEILKGAN